MNPTERIENLKASISVLEKQISNCKHVYGEVYSDPEKYMRPYNTHVRESFGGIDAQEIWSSTPDVKNRWSKKCTLCGKIVSTYTRKPVVVGLEPDFGNI